MFEVGWGLCPFTRTSTSVPLATNTSLPLSPPGPKNDKREKNLATTNQHPFFSSTVLACPLWPPRATTPANPADLDSIVLRPLVARRPTRPQRVLPGTTSSTTGDRPQNEKHEEDGCYKRFSLLFHAVRTSSANCRQPKHHGRDQSPLPARASSPNILRSLFRCCTADRRALPLPFPNALAREPAGGNHCAARRRRCSNGRRSGVTPLATPACRHLAANRPGLRPHAIA